MNHRKKRHLSYFRKVARPAVAIAAAYALALQVLLLSVIAAGAVMTSAADGSVICIGGKIADGSDQPSHSPAGFAECTLACAQGLTGAAVLPDGISPLPAMAIGQPLEQSPAAAFVLSPRPSPKLAQGPPQIA